jgi:hypothetical protein
MKKTIGELNDARAQKALDQQYHFDSGIMTLRSTYAIARSHPSQRGRSIALAARSTWNIPCWSTPRPRITWSGRMVTA